MSRAHLRIWSNWPRLPNSTLSLVQVASTVQEAIRCSWRVLEVATGKSYEQLLNETILEPLELSSTFHPGPNVDLSDAAKSYVFTVDGKKLAPEKHYSFLVVLVHFSQRRKIYSKSRVPWSMANLASKPGNDFCAGASYDGMELQIVTGPTLSSTPKQKSPLSWQVTR